MEVKDRLAEILAPYGQKKGALIPVLQQVQSELGYLPKEAVFEIARFLGMSKSEIFGVATFYAQFRFTRSGEYTVKVCLGTACYMRGGGQIMEAMEQKLSIKPGETTADFKFNLERVACFGCCALAPIIVVDGTVNGKMTRERAKEVVSAYE